MQLTYRSEPLKPYRTWLGFEFYCQKLKVISKNLKKISDWVSNENYALAKRKLKT